MAKGRKGKNKSSETTSNEQDEASAPPSVTQTQNCDRNEPEAEEKWDIIRRIEEIEKVPCRSCQEEKQRDGIATTSWVSNLNPSDTWDLCMECAEESFGELEEELRNSFDGTTKENDRDNQEESPKKDNDDNADGDPSVTENKTAKDANSKEGVVASTPTGGGNLISDDEKPKDTDTVPEEAKNETSPSDTTEASGDDELEADEMWEIKKLLPATDLSKESMVVCSGNDCDLAAAVLYVSSTTKERWYCCLDCQEIHFGGWPENLDEIPVKTLSREHKCLMISKCSVRKKPAFPPLPEPTPPSHTSPVHEETGKAARVTPVASGPRGTQMSAALVVAHRKWQEAAKKMGGPNARIVVSKSAAKKLVFERLYDEFRPMNITEIYNALKTVVPSPVLRSSLDEMCEKPDEGFAESEDEEGGSESNKDKLSSKVEGDEFGSSLLFKSGRNTNTSLYYIDHSKLQNNGNGLEPSARNELLADKAKAEQEESSLKSAIANMDAWAKQLNSEPTNEEATTKLAKDQTEVAELRGQLQEARKLKVNEKHKKKIKLRIEGMTFQWRKRKRLCMDFLINMEESTEGTVSLRKCLSGDGQIEIDSDERAVRDSIAFTKRKRERGQMGARRVKKAKTEPRENASKVPADENFVAVRLGPKGVAERVFMDTV